MRILLLTRDFPPQDGGIAQFAYGLSRALHDSGHDVAVHARWPDGSAERTAATPPFPVRWVGGKTPTGDVGPSEREAFGQYAAAAPPDLVIAVHWKAFRSVAGPAERLGCRSVLVIHAKEVTGRRPWHQRLRLKRALLAADHVVTVSRFTAEQTVARYGTPRNRVAVIHPGVDTDRFTPGAPDADTLKRLGIGDGPVLLTVARLVRRKGHDRVIEALPALRAEFPTVRYVICGNGNASLRRELERLAREVGVEDAVRFLGRVVAEDIPHLYRACDVCVMPSRELPGSGDSEGFGITFLEAGACERPVVGGRAGGVVDAIEDGVTGFLVDPNSTQALADTLVRLLRDPARARLLGQAGRARVLREFSWGSIAGRYLDLVG